MHVRTVQNSVISQYVQDTTSFFTCTLLKMDEVFFSKANAVIYLPILINFALNGDETATDLKKMLNHKNNTGDFKRCIKSDNPTVYVKMTSKVLLK